MAQCLTEDTSIYHRLKIDSENRCYIHLLAWAGKYRQADDAILDAEGDQGAYLRSRWELGSPEGGLMLYAEYEPDVPLENIEVICEAFEKVGKNA